MTDALFWDIVSALDWSKWNEDEERRAAADDYAVLEPAIRRLAELPVREICLFDEFLSWRAGGWGRVCEPPAGTRWRPKPRTRRLDPSHPPKSQGATSC